MTRSPIPSPRRLGGRRAVLALLPGLAALLFAAGPYAAAQTTGDPPSPAEEPSSSDTLFDQTDLGNVVQIANQHYHAGVRLLKRGDRLQEKAARDAGQAAPADERARAAWEAAAGEFGEAIGYQPDLMPAYAALGEAYRRLGRPGEALQVHARALARHPDDDDNFRGWALSALALDMLGDATQAYSRYLTADPERAALLMDLLEGWLAARRADPGDLDPAHVERLAAWIAEQQGSGG